MSVLVAILNKRAFKLSKKADMSDALKLSKKADMSDALKAKDKKSKSKE